MDWLDDETLEVLRLRSDSTLSVDDVEFCVTSPGGRGRAWAAYYALSDTDRQWRVFESLKRLVERGKVVRIKTEGMTISEQLFKASSLLEALAEAAAE